MDSSDRPPAVSTFSYVPATSQATYRLRSRQGILRGFDRGFWGKGSRAGNPTMARGYGQSPSTITIAMLTRWARFPGAGLGLRCSVSGPRCRVPGTEEGNRAIRRNARLMLRKRAHGVCYAKHCMAMRCHRLSLKSLGRRWYLSTFTSDEVPGSCPSLSRPGRCPRPRLSLRWEEAVRMVETTFSYTQSTFSPLSVHMWVHIQSTWGSTYGGPRTGFPMPGDMGGSMAFNAGWWKPCRTM
jgi:hypothetical protein